MLDDNGIVDLELEGIPYWWDDGPRREESDRIRHALLRAAEVLGARHIKVTPDGDDAPWDREHWAAKFAELAAQAHDAGTRLGIEFFPWSNIKTLHDGLRLVDDAGHDAAGVVIDVWHIDARPHARRRSRLRAAAPDHRGRAQRCRRRRSSARCSRTRCTGAATAVRGSFDLTGIITALRTAGWTGPWGVEILSEEHRSLPVEEALQKGGRQRPAPARPAAVQP